MTTETHIQLGNNQDLQHYIKKKDIELDGYKKEIEYLEQLRDQMLDKDDKSEFEWIKKKENTLKGFMDETPNKTPNLTQNNSCIQSEHNSDNESISAHDLHYTKESEKPKTLKEFKKHHRIQEKHIRSLEFENKELIKESNELNDKLKLMKVEVEQLEKFKINELNCNDIKSKELTIDILNSIELLSTSSKEKIQTLQTTISNLEIEKLKFSNELKQKQLEFDQKLEERLNEALKVYKLEYEQKLISEMLKHKEDMSVSNNAILDQKAEEIKIKLELENNKFKNEFVENKQRELKSEQEMIIKSRVNEFELSLKKQYEDKQSELLSHKLNEHEKSLTNNQDSTQKEISNPSSLKLKEMETKINNTAIEYEEKSLITNALIENLKSKLEKAKQDNRDIEIAKSKEVNELKNKFEKDLTAIKVLNLETLDKQKSEIEELSYACKNLKRVFSNDDLIKHNNDLLSFTITALNPTTNYKNNLIQELIHKLGSLDIRSDSSKAGLELSEINEIYQLTKLFTDKIYKKSITLVDNIYDKIYSESEDLIVGFMNDKSDCEPIAKHFVEKVWSKVYKDLDLLNLPSIQTEQLSIEGIPISNGNSFRNLCLSKNYIDFSYNHEHERNKKSLFYISYVESISYAPVKRWIPKKKKKTVNKIVSEIFISLISNIRSNYRKIKFIEELEVDNEISLNILSTTLQMKTKARVNQLASESDYQEKERNVQSSNPTKPLNIKSSKTKIQANGPEEDQVQVQDRQVCSNNTGGETLKINPSPRQAKAKQDKNSI